MGADFLGWRDCTLQRELGEEGFLHRIKLRAYRRLIEERVPEAQRDVVQIRVSVTGRPDRNLTYPVILRELAEFERGAPECADCPLSGGKPVGCYRYVTYPIDAAMERCFFDFFLSQVAETDSICNQVFRDIASRIGDNTAWHRNRGPQGGLAILDRPMESEFEWDGQVWYIDSAQVLASAFVTLRDPALLIAYARFYREFLEFVARRVGLQSDGHIKVEVDATDVASVEDIAFRANVAVERVQAIADSTTLRELEEVADLLLHAAVRSIDSGWRVLVDG